VRLSQGGGTLNWTVQSGLGTVDSTGLYFPPLSIPRNTTAVIRATNAADGTKYDEASISLLVSDAAAMPPVGVRGGCGSCDYTDGSSNVWHGDLDRSPSVRLTSAGSAENTGLTIEGSPADQPLYTTRRYAYGTIRYQFNVPPNNYTLRLLWNSSDAPSNPNYLINVKVNGSTVIAGADITALAGGNDSPYSTNLSVSVGSDHLLTVDFTPAVGEGLWPYHARISAIQLLAQ
jgi:hypothetical protein